MAEKLPQKTQRQLQYLRIHAEGQAQKAVEKSRKRKAQFEKFKGGVKKVGTGIKEVGREAGTAIAQAIPKDSASATRARGARTRAGVRKLLKAFEPPTQKPLTQKQIMAMERRRMKFERDKMKHQKEMLKMRLMATPPTDHVRGYDPEMQALMNEPDAPTMNDFLPPENVMDTLPPQERLSLLRRAQNALQRRRFAQNMQNQGNMASRGFLGQSTILGAPNVMGQSQSNLMQPTYKQDILSNLWGGANNAFSERNQRSKRILDEDLSQNILNAPRMRL